MESIPRYRMSGLWSSIASVGDKSNVCCDVFCKGVGYLAGEVRRVHFWLNDCLGWVFCWISILECLAWWCPIKSIMS